MYDTVHNTRFGIHLILVHTESIRIWRTTMSANEFTLSLFLFIFVSSLLLPAAKTTRRKKVNRKAKHTKLFSIFCGILFYYFVHLASCAYIRPNESNSFCNYGEMVCLPVIYLCSNVPKIEPAVKYLSQLLNQCLYAQIRNIIEDFRCVRIVWPFVIHFIILFKQFNEDIEHEDEWTWSCRVMIERYNDEPKGKKPLYKYTNCHLPSTAIYA